MSRGVQRQDRDLLGTRWALWLLWIGPWALVVGTVDTSDIMHTIVWSLSFTVGGAACLVNAIRCGRLHCFYTGPVYLAAALASLLYGLHMLPLGRHGWMWIIDAAGAATLITCFGLEPLFGKYKTTRA